MSFHNFIKTYYGPLLLRPIGYLRGLRALFGECGWRRGGMVLQGRTCCAVAVATLQAHVWRHMFHWQPATAVENLHVVYQIVI
jgi:hypothetical protein